MRADVCVVLLQWFHVGFSENPGNARSVCCFFDVSECDDC